MNFDKKYFKYKNKYLNNTNGGSTSISTASHNKMHKQQEQDNLKEQDELRSKLKLDIKTLYNEIVKCYAFFFDYFKNYHTFLNERDRIDFLKKLENWYESQQTLINNGLDYSKIEYEIDLLPLNVYEKCKSDLLLLLESLKMYELNLNDPDQLLGQLYIFFNIIRHYCKNHYPLKFNKTKYIMTYSISINLDDKLPDKLYQLLSNRIDSISSIINDFYLSIIEYYTDKELHDELSKLKKFIKSLPIFVPFDLNKEKYNEYVNRKLLYIQQQFKFYQELQQYIDKLHPSNSSDIESFISNYKSNSNLYSPEMKPPTNNHLKKKFDAGYLKSHSSTPPAGYLNSHPSAKLNQSGYLHSYPPVMISSNGYLK